MKKLVFCCLLSFNLGSKSGFRRMGSNMNIPELNISKAKNP